MPVSGNSLYGLNATIGNGVNPIGLNWLNGNQKGFGGAYNIAAMQGLEWYAKNNSYNCTLNNCSQCEPAFVSGNYNCAAVQGNPSAFDGGASAAANCGLTNCTANGACNCACNCDNRAWLQSNCNCGANCNCAYNCNYNNCNCNCDCAPTNCRC